MTNTDPLQKYKARLIDLEQQRRELAEDIRDLRSEMKGAGLSKIEMAAVFLAMRREFEDPKARAHRLDVEELALALGAFADSPLGEAAMKAMQ